MHEVPQRPNQRRSLEVDLKGFESYYNFTREKMIDICCVGSSVTYHSLSYWSIVMMSRVEFLTGECRAKRCERSFKMAQPTRKTNKGLLESLEGG